MGNSVHGPQPSVAAFSEGFHHTLVCTGLGGHGEAEDLEIH